MFVLQCFMLSAFLLFDFLPWASAPQRCFGSVATAAAWTLPSLDVQQRSNETKDTKRERERERERETKRKIRRIRKKGGEAAEEEKEERTTTLELARIAKVGRMGGEKRRHFTSTSTVESEEERRGDIRKREEREREKDRSLSLEPCSSPLLLPARPLRSPTEKEANSESGAHPWDLATQGTVAQGLIRWSVPCQPGLYATAPAVDQEH